MLSNLIANVERKLTVDQLKNLRRFRDLTLSQKRYVVAIVEGASPLMAYASAYNVDLEKAARDYNAPAKSEAVQRVIRIAFGSNEGEDEMREKLMSDVDHAINYGATQVELAGLLIRSQLMGLIPRDHNPWLAFEKRHRDILCDVDKLDA